jgi:hypothetical protein
MIRFNGFNCWSPEPPPAYTVISNGIPVGPAGVYVDYATGCEYAKAVGHNSVTPSEGMAIWNLVWLLCPHFDLLPAIAKTKDFDAFNRFPDDPRLAAEVFLIALQWGQLLLADPVPFVNQAVATKTAFPGVLTHQQIKARAEEARGNPKVTLEGGKVIKVKFGG